MYVCMYGTYLDITYLSWPISIVCYSLPQHHFSYDDDGGGDGDDVSSYF